MLVKSIFLAILLFSINVNAAAPNIFSQPSCVYNVKALPIFRLDAKISTGGVGLSNSTVFLVGKNKWATTSHSIGHGRYKYLQININGTKILAKTLHYDKKLDFAILEADSGNLIPLNLRLDTAPLKKFELAWSVGYPDAYDPDTLWSFQGQLLHYKDGDIVISAMVIPGMSGGPALTCRDDKTLEVIGIAKSHPWITISETVVTAKDGKTYITRNRINAGKGTFTPISEAIKYIVLDENNYIIWENVPTE